MKTMKEIKANVGGKDGKNFWKTIGVVFFKDGGKISMKLNMMPLGWDGWAIICDKQEKKGAEESNSVGDSEEMPF